MGMGYRNSELFPHCTLPFAPLSLELSLKKWRKKKKGTCWGQFVANSLCFSLNKTSLFFSCLTDKKQPTDCKCQLTSLSPKGGVERKGRKLSLLRFSMFLPIVFTAFLLPGSSSASPGFKTQRCSDADSLGEGKNLPWERAVPSGALAACYSSSSICWSILQCLFLFAVLSSVPNW